MTVRLPPRRTDESRVAVPVATELNRTTRLRTAWLLVSLLKAVPIPLAIEMYPVGLLARAETVRASASTPVTVSVWVTAEYTAVAGVVRSSSRSRLSETGRDGDGIIPGTWRRW